MNRRFFVSYFDIHMPGHVSIGEVVRVFLILEVAYSWSRSVHEQISGQGVATTTVLNYDSEIHPKIYPPSSVRKRDVETDRALFLEKFIWR